MKKPTTKTQLETTLKGLNTKDINNLKLSLRKEFEKKLDDLQNKGVKDVSKNKDIIELNNKYIIIDELSKSNNINEASKNIAKQLNSTKTAEIKAVITKYIKEFGEDFKNKLGELIDEIAEKVGAKINLMSSKQGIGVDKTKILSDDLVSEAKKYKTFEEFKKAQGEELYHGSKGKYTDFTTFDKSKIGSSVGSDKEGIFFTNSKTLADRYTFNNKTGEKGNILNSYIDFKKPLEIEVKQTPLSYFNFNKDKIMKDVKKGGYDGVKIFDKANDENIIIALNPNQIKTEAQLKQIYEQAKK